MTHLDKNIKNCLTNSFIETNENKLNSVNTAPDFNLENLQKQASLGIASAQYALSKYYLDNNINIDEAKELLLQAVNANHVNAMTDYINMLKNGIYFEKDTDLAYQYSKKVIELKPTLTNLNLLTNLVCYQNIGEYFVYFEQIINVLKNKIPKKYIKVIEKNVNNLKLKLKNCKPTELSKTSSNIFEIFEIILDGISDRDLINIVRKNKSNKISNIIDNNYLKIIIAYRLKKSNTIAAKKKANSMYQEIYDSYVSLLENASIFNINNEEIFDITENIYTLFDLKLLNDDTGLQKQYWAKKMFNACVTLANAGNIKAQANLASYYEEGLGCDIDKDKYLYWCTKAADGNFSPNCIRLACSHLLKYLSNKKNINIKDIENDENINKAIFYIQKSNTPIFSCLFLAIFHICKGQPSDYEKAFNYLKQCEDSLANSLFNESFISIIVYMIFSTIYFIGLGTKRNFDLGVEYFYKASCLNFHNKFFNNIFTQGQDIIIDLMYIKLSKQEDIEYRKYVINSIKSTYDSSKTDPLLELAMQGYKYPQEFIVLSLFKKDPSLSISEQESRLILHIKAYILALYNYIKSITNVINVIDIDIDLTCAMAKILIDKYESKIAYILYTVLRILRKKMGFDPNTQYDDIIEFANEKLNNGELICNYIFALLYYKGIGVTQNIDKANEYMQKGIEYETTITSQEELVCANFIELLLFKKLSIILDHEYTDAFNKELKSKIKSKQESDCVKK